MPGKYVILSFYDHVSGPCNFSPLMRFDSKEEAIKYFDVNRNDYKDNNPTYYLVACEQEDGSFLDLNGRIIT